MTAQNKPFPVNANEGTRQIGQSKTFAKPFAAIGIQAVAAAAAFKGATKPKGQDSQRDLPPLLRKESVWS